jgi:hypothetical protein
VKILSSILIAGALFVASVGIAAADPVPAGCDKARGTITCTTTETAGNAPEHSNAQRVTDTTTQKGSFESSHEPVVTCDGPPGQCK